MRKLFLSNFDFNPKSSGDPVSKRTLFLFVHCSRYYFHAPISCMLAKKVINFSDICMYLCLSVGVEE